MVKDGGWSWGLFFFASFFGIPWFLRDVPKVGFTVLGVNILGFLLPSPLRLILTVAYLGFNIWAAINGNRFTVQQKLRRGWALVDVNDPAIQERLKKQREELENRRIDPSEQLDWQSTAAGTDYGDSGSGDWGGW